MVLALAVGFGLRAWLGWIDAPWIGLLVGMVAAQLLPRRGACPIARD